MPAGVEAMRISECSCSMCRGYLLSYFTWHVDQFVHHGKPHEEVLRLFVFKHYQVDEPTVDMLALILQGLSHIEFVDLLFAIHRSSSVSEL